MKIKDITLSKENRDKFNIPISGEVVIPGFVTDPDTGELCRITRLATDLFIDTDHTDMTSVVVPPTVTDILPYCFAELSTLSKVILPDSIKTLNYGVFAECENLVDVKLPETLEGIGVGVFRYCHELKKIAIPNSIKEIGQYAFLDCHKLEDVEVPATVEDVDIAAFDLVPHITYHGNLPGAPWGAKRMN